MLGGSNDVFLGSEEKNEDEDIDWQEDCGKGFEAETNIVLHQRTAHYFKIGKQRFRLRFLMVVLFVWLEKFLMLNLGDLGERWSLSPLIPYDKDVEACCL